MFEPKYFEDEPCDGCGTKEAVVSMGHGSYSCEKCFNAWWCPKCHYALGEKHVCPTPEEIIVLERKNEETMLLIGDEETVAKIIAERDALKAEVEELKHQLTVLRKRW